jgi:putative tricarboxylic transport membrane protein
MEDLKRNWSDIIGSLILIIIGTSVVVGSIRLRIGTPTNPQPGFFPFLGGVILVGLSLILLAYGWRGHGKRIEAFGEIRRPAILVMAMAGYVGVLDHLGYVPATFLIALVILRVLGVKSWKVLGLASVLLAGGTYLLFARLLGIELPAGILEFLG